MYPYISYTKSKKDLGWRAEDSFYVSKTKPIFGIADGVTLPKYENTESPTLARQVADIFSMTTTEYIEKHPESISTEKIHEAYNYAKNKIQEHYEKLKVDLDGRRGVTGAVAIIQEDKIIGSRFLDSGLALFRKGKQIFKTPEFWSWKKKEDDRPYPYITLNEDMKTFIQTYDIPYEKGDFLVLYTDGFEDQFSLPEFTSIFASENLKEVEEKLKNIDDVLSEKETKKWGDERTIVVTQI
jgi:serine/threonine protein phosphatase PrpC